MVHVHELDSGGGASVTVASIQGETLTRNCDPEACTLKLTQQQSLARSNHSNLYSCIYRTKQPVS